MSAKLPLLLLTLLLGPASLAAQKPQFMPGDVETVRAVTSSRMEAMVSALRALAAEKASAGQSGDRREEPGTFAELLPNGTFESGAVEWVSGSVNGWPLILDFRSLPITSHSGTWGAWLGGGADEISVIEQLVRVPADSPRLKYWHWITSDDECGFDVAGVVVNVDWAIDSYWLCQTDDTGGWVLYTVDMSTYAGRTILLSLVVSTDEVYDSSLLVDDVALEFVGDRPNIVFADGFESGDPTLWD